MKLKIQWEKLKENLLDPKKPLWILITLVLMGGTLIMLQRSESVHPANMPNEAETLDTFIPAGFVLVTLQLINSDSIESLVGDFGLVDLYPGNANQDFLQEKSIKPIATRLKLIRSPNNPSLFGVLVPEEDPHIIQRLSAPVFAVIQAPNVKPLPSPLSTAPRKNRLIKYGDLL